MAKQKGIRLNETLAEAQIELLESEGGTDNTEGPWKIRGVGNIADVVNGNGRRYRAEVLRAAVEELQTHLHESAGQGRLIVLGESDHPSDKGNRQPQLLETVVNWETVSFDGSKVLLEGLLLGTSKGRDIRALMKGGVKPGVSQRAYGEGKTIKESGRNVFEPEWLKITGYDLTAPNMQSMAGAEITDLFESLDETQEDEMTVEELKQMIGEHPELLEGLKGQVENLTEAKVAEMEGEMRKKLGIDAKADIGQALEEALQAKKQLEETKRKAAVDAAIAEGTKELPYGDLNESFVDAVKGANLQTAEAAKALIESKRQEYDALMSKIKLNALGFVPGVQVVGPVIERQANVPEYARGAFELQESLRRAGRAHNWSANPQEMTPNERFTQLYLESFDKQYKHHLIQEARLLQEAETTSDLSLPYSVSRAIVAEAFPMLVATSIFDVGMTDQSPSRIYFEAHSAETGYTVTVTDEVVTGGAEGTWYDLDYKRVTPGSVTVTSNPAGTTYTENTDYVIDYANGKILFLEAGSIGANDVLVDYTYTAIRKGENAAIERAKVTLSYETLEIEADRLATEISREAVVFSRSQLGWDATSRTLASLVRQVARKIDQGLMYMALVASLQQASNSGGTWTDGTDSLDVLVKYLGYAKVKVANRYYDPTFFLMSVTNADKLSNWDGFSRGGFPNAVMNSAGYAGSLKGLPIYASTEFPDTYALCGNREVVMHRVFQAMQLRGPFPSYSSNKLIANDQYYAEEFNGSASPVVEKAAHIIIA